MFFDNRDNKKSTAISEAARFYLVLSRVRQRFLGSGATSATRNKTDAETYMERIVALANGHMNSRKIVDRSKAIEELILSMEQTGVLTCVLDGKNLGKSFLKEAALQRCSSNLVVLSEDMRNKPGANLLDALLQVANRTEEGKDLKAVVLPALSAIFSAGLVAFEGLGPAAVPISKFCR